MAASAPPTPDEALVLVSDPTASLCGNFVRSLLRLPVLFYNLVSWLLDDSGAGIRTIEAGDLIYSFAPLVSNQHRLRCDGASYSTTTYAVLYTAIGNAYDTMDGQSAPGAGFFRVPKCGARFPLATGSLPVAGAVSLGSVGGEEQHVLTAAEVAKHEHLVWPENGGDGNASKNWCHFDWGGGGADSRIDQAPIMPNDVFPTQTRLIAEEQDQEDAGHNTIPPYFGVHCYIATGI